MDFWFTVVLDPTSVCDVDAGNVAWFLHCVPGRLKYVFGENPNFFRVDIARSESGVGGSSVEIC